MRSLLVLGAVGLATPLHAQEPEEGGVSAEIAYTAEVFSGGGEGSGPIVDNFDLVVDARRGSTKFHIYGLYNNGRDFSGPRFRRGYVASNIETGVKAVRLYEAWVEQEFADGRVSLLAGLYDLNSEFDALEASSLFINPAHGIGTDFSQSGSNGPSIFPVTSLALRTEIRTATSFKIRAAILDAVPGDPSRPKRTAVKLNKGDGALLIAEAEKMVGKWRLIAGHWRYTARFEDQLASQLVAAPVLKRGNAGYYLRGEGRVSGTDEQRHADAFFRLGIADARFNEVEKFASAGVAISRPFTGRPNDMAGFAVTWSGSSSRAKTLQRLQGQAIASNEWSLEATYSFVLTNWLSLQPDAQYLMNPSFELGRKAWVAGLRAKISFAL